MSMPGPAEVRLLLVRCGLSHNDAADYFGTDVKVVRRWLDGRYEIGAERWQRLCDLCDLQDRAAEEALAQIDRTIAELGAVPGSITIRLARTQEDADRLGWPCPAAHHAVVRRVAEWAPEGLTIRPVYPDEDAAADMAAARRMAH
jgi:hypothetical protein